MITLPSRPFLTAIVTIAIRTNDATGFLTESCLKDAFERAKELDRHIQETGQAGTLYSLPFSIKDQGLNTSPGCIGTSLPVGWWLTMMPSSSTFKRDHVPRNADASILTRITERRAVAFELEPLFEMLRKAAVVQGQGLSESTIHPPVMQAMKKYEAVAELRENRSRSHGGGATGPEKWMGTNFKALFPGWATRGSCSFFSLASSSNPTGPSSHPVDAILYPVGG
ncbi:hypothetical protein OG21DRAFT_1604636 [Imleria badia]|nr:hypothetical protein OG21DRAFT_1604636 [Imleria badia]